jgi:phenylacetate-CoA ligase
MVESNLLRLMQYAGMNCPYYENLFRMNNINVFNIEDFFKIPVLTKQIIQQNERLIISRAYRIEDLIVERTSGSTGLPLYCRYDKEERVRRSMFLWRERKRNSPSIIGQRMVNFHAGNRVQGTSLRENNIEIDEKNKVLYLNYLDMNKNTVTEYYNAIARYKPFFIRCQPSAICEFIRFCKKNGLETSSLGVEYIELAGEFVHDYVAEEVKNAFPNAFVANQYGAQEFFCIAYSCRFNSLHILEDSVYVEILNKDQDGFGEIVITSLNNYAMPFIRYKIGDIGRVIHTGCNCEKQEAILELKSARSCEYFELNGHKVHGNIFKNCIEKFNANKNDLFIRQFQVFQVSEDSFVINIISERDGFTEEFKNFTENYIKSRMDLVVNVKAELCEELQINPVSRKLKMYNFLK